MTNQEVFAAFANRAEANGRAVRSERTPFGVVLYSYATPIAYLTDDDTVPVFTERRYSPTTGKQKSQAMREFPEVVEVRDEVFRNAAQRYGAYFGMAR